MIQRYALLYYHTDSLNKKENGDYVLYEDHLAELAEKDKQFDELLTGKIPEVMLSELQYKDGKIDMIASHPVFHAFVEEATRMFDSAGAINFLSMAGKNSEGIVFDVIIQRTDKKPVSEVLAEKDKEIERLKKRLEHHWAWEEQP